MKKIFTYAVSLLLVAGGVVGCNMEPKLTLNISVEQSTASVQDINNILTGALNQFASYRFIGRNLIALSDMASDISQYGPSSGHFQSINLWTFDDGDEYLNDIYTSGYVVADACTRGIIGADKLIAERNEKMNSADEATKATLANEIAALKSIKAELLSLKGMTYFYLVNIFGKAYSPEHSGGYGLVLIKDELIKPKEKVTRATLQETYDYIIKLFEESLALPCTETRAIYPNPLNTKAFLARTYLYMGNWQKAAELSAELIGSGDIPTEPGTAQAYADHWKSTAIGAEDLFSLLKSDQDNLSANSLNGLYGDYAATLNPDMVKAYFKHEEKKQINGKDTTVWVPNNDYRFNLITEKSKEFATPHPMKFNGMPTNSNLTNIPVMRVSELYLIAAEANAQLGNVAEAQKALFFTASRNTDVTAADKLPAGKDELLQYIAAERVREFFQEGHRYFDLRRTGAVADIAGDPAFKFYNFVYPIPRSEINAGYLDKQYQNDDWKNNLPKRK